MNIPDKEEILEKVKLIIESEYNNISDEEKERVGIKLQRTVNRVYDALNDTRQISSKAINNFCEELYYDLHMTTNSVITNHSNMTKEQILTDMKYVLSSDIKDIDKTEANLNLAVESGMTRKNNMYYNTLESRIVECVKSNLSKLRSFPSSRVQEATYDIKRMILGRQLEDICYIHSECYKMSEKNIMQKIDSYIGEIKIIKNDKDNRNEFEKSLKNMTKSKESVYEKPHIQPEEKTSKEAKSLKPIL